MGRVSRFIFLLFQSFFLVSYMLRDADTAYGAIQNCVAAPSAPQKPLTEIDVTSIFSDEIDVRS